jgi:membrane protease YdiL (CAAX protease family)
MNDAHDQHMDDELIPPDPAASPPVSESRPGFRSWFRPPFRNQGGLSALQFIPLYLFVGVILFLLISTVLSYILPPGFNKLWGQLLAEAALAISAIAPAVLISKIEDRPFALYGLPSRLASGKLFWHGALWGLIWLSILLVAMRLCGLFYFGHLSLRGAHVWKFAAFWAVFFLFVAVFEEFTFRGYPLFAFAEAAGFWPSALLLAAIFGYTHRSNVGETWMGALGAAAIGLFFSFTRLRTGNLWFAVGMHASWDLGQTFIYGVPDSGTRLPGHLLDGQLQGPNWLTGGSVGPEGSALIFVLIILMWIAFNRLYPPRASDASTQSMER